MATILNAYNLSGGDTTSSTFTSSVDCVSILAVTTSFSGVNSLLKIQSSDDQSTWKDIGQILLSVGSDIYCSDPVKVTGIYVRCLLVTNDSTSGTITVTATNGAAGTGDLLSTNNLSDVANAETSNHNLGNSHTTYVPTFTPLAGALSTCTCLGDSFVIQIDTDSISFTMQLAITMDALETAAAFDFDLPTGLLPYANFAATSDLTPIISLPNSGSWADLLTQNVVIGANAGAKTGVIAVVSPAASVVKLPIFIRYHR